LFAKRWFSDDVILVSVTWYLRFKLSYRDLAQIMGQLGVSVAPCTILRSGDSVFDRAGQLLAASRETGQGLLALR
jgi:transposase-like protein